MNRNKLLRFLVITTLGFTACTSSSGLRPYRGVQKEWKTSSGATPDNVGGVLIYRTYPEKPYEIIGSIEVSGSQWQVGGLTESQLQLEKRILKNAAIESKKYGADAIFLSNQQNYLDRVANVGSEGEQQIPIYGNRSSVTVIRFKNEPPSIRKSIVGIWMANRSDKSGNDDFSNPIFKFNEDGSCELSVEVNGNRKTIKNGSYSASDDTIAIIPGNRPKETMKYRITDKSLFLIIDGEEAKFTRMQ
jgi:hypothetical protein